MQDPEASVDDILSEEESSEEELGSLAVNIGSLNHTRGGSSDTDADFLGKSFDSKKEAIKRANKALQGDDEYKSNMADDEHSVCGSERVCDKKSVKVDISPPSTYHHQSVPR